MFYLGVKKDFFSPQVYPDDLVLKEKSLKKPLKTGKKSLSFKGVYLKGEVTKI